MKKIIQPKRYVSYVSAMMLLATLIIFGCKKDKFASESLNSTSDNELLSAAKSYFDSEINIKTKNPNNSILTPRQKLTKDAIFEAAYVQEVESKRIVVIPIIYVEHELYLKNNGRYISLSDLSNLIIYKDNDNVNHAEIVTRIPTDEYLLDTSKNKKFSGLVNVEDWHGNFKAGYKYKDGKIVGAYNSPTSVVANYANMNSLKKENDFVCITTNYYSYSYTGSSPGGGDEIDNTKKASDFYCCNFIDSETQCYYVSNNNSNYNSNFINYSLAGGGSSNQPPGGSANGCGGYDSQSIIKTIQTITYKKNFGDDPCDNINFARYVRYYWAIKISAI